MYGKEISIGKVLLKSPVILAPMDGVTDLPFRFICRDFGADLVFNEFIQAEAAEKEAHKHKTKLDIDFRERPVALQIYTSDPESAARACRRIEQEYRPDIIDLNFGCWKPGICRRGTGAGALDNIEKSGEIVRRCADAVGIPVTVKTRLGPDESSIVINRFAPLLEEAGAAAITLHCRTRKQGMGGKADWSYFNSVKKKISIPLFLNGDIFTPEDARRAFETTEADGIAIGRASMGNPFIFKQIKRYLETGEYEEISLFERIETCFKHLDLAYQYKGYYGMRAFRKYYKSYLSGLPNAEELRKKLVRLEDYSEVLKVLSEIEIQ